MADKPTSKPPASAKTEAAEAKGEATGEPKPRKRGPGRPPAFKLDTSKAVDSAEIVEVSASRSSQRSTLVELKELTEKGEVPEGSDGRPKFIPVGEYSNPSGAQGALKSIQKRADEDKNFLPGVFEFKKQITVVNGEKGSQLLARFVGERSA